MRVRCLLFLAVWLSPPALAAGGWAPAKQLDAWLDVLEKDQLASMTVAVSENGALRYGRSIGFATIENGVPRKADAGTRYRAGPVSGLFTAVLVMQRVETATITLDTPLAEFYPDLPNALHITYRDLLGQRSGLANYTAAADFDTWRTKPKTRIELLDLIANSGARFEPRERVEYSDSNYLVLGFMLETIQDRSYDDILVRQVVGKLGMSRTYFAGSGNARLESRPYRHTSSGWVAAEQTDPTVAGGALGVVSTPAELVRFVDALFKGELVSAQSLDSMRNQDGGSGLGLWTHEIAGQTGLGQSGGFDGFTASVFHFPSRGISIACMSNALAVPMNDIVDQLLTTVLVRGYRPTTPTALRQAE